MTAGLEETDLGKPVAYVDTYTPSLLKGIARTTMREGLGIEGVALPFTGVDVWTGYELSWLNRKGRPEVAALRVTIPAQSSHIPESKAFKLYLNSFANSQFVSRQDVENTVESDLKLAVRAGGGFGLALAFFLIMTVMIPFGVGPESEILARIAPGILWVGALLACLLSLDRIFATDFEDGSLELLATAPLPLEALVAVKALAHWITTGLPLTLAAPVFGLFLSLPEGGRGSLVAFKKQFRDGIHGRINRTV